MRSSLLSSSSSSFALFFLLVASSSSLCHAAFLVPPSSSTCQQDLDVDFDALMEDISTNPSSLCNPDYPDCACANPLIPQEGNPSYDEFFQQAWLDLHQSNVNDASMASDSLKVLMFGDSITERWRGTNFGVYDLDFKVLYTIAFNALFGADNTNTEGLALGLAGDRTPNLLYRIQNGELPSSNNINNDWVIWILIGTNDLSDDCSREAILVGIINIVKVLDELLSSSSGGTTTTTTTIVLNGILPRESFLFGDLIDWINERLECFANVHVPSSSSLRVAYYDATNIFLNFFGTDVSYIIMPDGLHPNPLGMYKWGRAIANEVNQILG